MMNTVLRKLTAFCVALLCAGLVQAGDWEDAVSAYDRKDYATALEKFRIRAQQGSASAQFNLGFMYANGQGVVQDYAEAVRLYKLAAQQGDARAQGKLGFIYANGKGVAQDFKESVRWFRLAAQQGLASAQHDLGVMYSNGKGVLQDNTRAYMWYYIATVDGGENRIKNRDIAASKMTAQQIEQAQRMARECMNSNFQKCE
jgi:TPR repeat protein